MDGILREEVIVPKAIQGALLARVKLMAGVDIGVMEPTSEPDVVELAMIESLLATGPPDWLLPQPANKPASPMAAIKAPRAFDRPSIPHPLLSATQHPRLRRLAVVLFV